MADTPNTPADTTPPPASPMLRLLFAIPLVVSGAALVGTLWFLNRDTGRTATGDRVRIHLQSACLERTERVVRARIDSLGLPAPELVAAGDGLDLTLTLPGLPDDRTAIPALLTAPGRLSVRVSDQEVATEGDVAGTGINLGPGGDPYLELAFQAMAVTALREASASGAPMTLLLDGRVMAEGVGADQIEDQKLAVYPADAGPQERMRLAADWSLILNSGPHGCPVVATTVADAPPAG